jgi:hypothetical protein
MKGRNTNSNISKIIGCKLTHYAQIPKLNLNLKKKKPMGLTVKKGDDEERTSMIK